MIRTLFGILCIACITGIAGSITLHAQDGEEDEFEYVSENPPYYGLGAGYMRVLMFPDYEPIDSVSRDLGLGDFSGPLHMDVFGITFTPGFIPNLRFGFYGGLGTTQLTRQMILRDDTVARTMYLTSVFGALQVDYALQISPAFTIFAGGMLGYGRNTLGASQTRITGARFSDVFNGPLFQADTVASLENLNRFARALSYHIFIYPSINFEYTLTPNIMMRLGGGYNTSLRVTPWSDEGGVELLDPKPISVNGLAAQIGIFVGLFQH